MAQTGLHCSGKIRHFVENLIFLSFYQKSGYCMKIDNF